MRAVSDVGLTNARQTCFAERGARLALSRIRLSGPNHGQDAVVIDALGVVEINADNRIAATVVFDLDDVDAAFDELDARYLAGEANAHAHTWSVMTGALAAVNRHELPEVAPDWVNIDHRRAVAFAPGDMTAYMHATWDHGPDGRAYIEVVHRLSNLGAIVTQVGHEISPQGFEAEWRMLNLLTLEGDRFNRSEIFDEADLDAALARFDELSRPARQLTNAASEVNDRYDACFAARDWDAMAETLTDDTSADDRRRVVNAGIRHGRVAEIASMRAVAELGVTNATSIVIATRGQRLALSRTHFTGRDQGPGAFRTEIVDIVEIDAANRISARVAFDVDDIGAAFEELDARFLAGEAAAYAHTWSVIARGLAAFNRRELPGFTPDSVNIDHRRARGFAPGDLTAYIGATWDLAPDVTAYAVAVHRLSNLGAVWTHAVSGTSQDGFDAEWREICLATIEGDLINRIEMFEDEDLDAALARFDELSRPAPRLDNAASRTYDRFNSYLAARDWDAMAELIADDACNDDRRRVVSGGIQRGRDAQIANLRAVIDVGVRNMESVVIATRGERLALTRTRVSGGDQRPDAFGVELLNITEIDTDNRISAGVLFDVDDTDAAFEELDARYLAGEAASHSQTWSVIAQGYAAANRGELAATVPDLVNIDNRQLAMIESGELVPYLRDTFDELANFSTYVEAVHRLTDLGVVVTHVGAGTSKEGFDAEWRMINVVVVDGDLISRSEMFDEVDIDTALARFDELNRPAP
jgi:hypothetical protein